MKSLKRVWAAAQRTLIAKRKLSGIGAEPKATITILNKLFEVHKETD